MSNVPCSWHKIRCYIFIIWRHAIINEQQIGPVPQAFIAQAVGTSSRLAELKKLAIILDKS